MLFAREFCEPARSMSDGAHIGDTLACEAIGGDECNSAPTPTERAALPSRGASTALGVVAEKDDVAIVHAQYRCSV